MQGLLSPSMVAATPKPERLTGNYYVGGKQGDFIQQVMPYAIDYARRTGQDPRMAIATAALESGWGKHAPGGMLFGIKGKGQEQETTEYVDGKPVRMMQSFRSYANENDPTGANFQDFADLLGNDPRYAGVQAAAGRPLEEQLRAFVESPYATAPEEDRYKELLSIASRIHIPKQYLDEIEQARFYRENPDFDAPIVTAIPNEPEPNRGLLGAAESAFNFLTGAGAAEANPISKYAGKAVGQAIGKGLKKAPSAVDDFSLQGTRISQGRVVPSNVAGEIPRPKITGQFEEAGNAIVPRAGSAGSPGGALVPSAGEAAGIGAGLLGAGLLASGMYDPSRTAEENAAALMQRQLEAERQMRDAGYSDYEIAVAKSATPQPQPQQQAATPSVTDGLNPDMSREQIDALLDPATGQAVLSEQDMMQPARELASYDVVPPQPVEGVRGSIDNGIPKTPHPYFGPAQPAQQARPPRRFGLLDRLGAGIQSMQANPVATSLLATGLSQAFGEDPATARQVGMSYAQLIDQQNERRNQRQAIANLVRQAGGTDEMVAAVTADPSLASPVFKSLQPQARDYMKAGDLIFDKSTGQFIRPPSSSEQAQPDSILETLRNFPELRVMYERGGETGVRDAMKGLQDRRAEYTAGQNAYSNAISNFETVTRSSTEINEILNRNKGVATPIAQWISVINPAAGDRRRLDSFATNLKSNLFLGELVKLKEASKTGASGLGQVTAPEIKRLEGRIADLDLNAGADKLFEDVQSILADYKKMLDRMESELSKTSEKFGESFTRQERPEAPMMGRVVNTGAAQVTAKPLPGATPLVYTGE